MKGVTRFLAGGLSILLLAAGLVAVPLTAASAASTMTLTATASPSILAGAPVSVTLSASNPSTTDDFNLSYRYELPAGATYVAGSAGTSTGEPTIVTITDQAGPPAVTHQVLVWSNVSDLSSDDTESISFSVQPDPAVFPVGSTVTGQAAAYANSDARTLPKFDASGTVVPGSYTDSATATSSTTTVSALAVTKTEPSPEHELMRGVHDQPTKYSFTVRNTASDPTNAVTAVDYLPAGLEFLGCGAVDNTTAGAVEYPGANRLDRTVPTALASSDCPTPVSVDTVTDPAGRPAGVYTKVTWSIGQLTAQAPVTISYYAAVPLRANTDTWTGQRPTAASGAQTANLDNNSGALTRQTGGAQAFTNTVVATGTYTGPVASGASTAVSATDSVTIKASDLSIVKTTDPTFVAGQLSPYDLLVRSSEYVSDDGMTITDVLDDGLCPAVPAGTPTSGDPIPADCAPSVWTGSQATITNASATNLAYDASTGEFTLTLVPTDQPYAPNTAVHIGYNVLMRTAYSGTPRAGQPTAVGDSFTNRVSIAGRSTAVPATGQTPATVDVTDDSRASKSTVAPSISKKILARQNVATATDCAAQAGSYTASTTATGPIFQLGDRVCFELTVNFSADTITRNARITDLLPANLSLPTMPVAGQDYALGGANTLPADQVAVDTRRSTAGAPVWDLGTTQSGQRGLFVAKGAVAVLYLSATVTTAKTQAAAPDLVDNLMKYRQANTAGAALALRDSAGFRVAPAPQVGLAKTIVSDSTDPVAQPVKTATAREGSVVGFSLSVSNLGTAAAGNARDVNAVTVWDALPPGITCSDVTAVSDSGVCSDTPPAGIDAAHGSASVIVWTLPTVRAAGSASVTYSVTVPQGVSVSTALRNDASVTSFTAQNSDGTPDGGTTQFYPTSSLDQSHSAAANAPQANDSATITVPDAAVTKTGVTSIAETGNDAANQAVGGENVSYTYGVTVPAQSSVYGGVLADALPTGIDTTAATANLATLPDGTTQGPGTFSFGGASFTLSSTGTLTFPASYDNFTAGAGSAQAFSVTVTGLRVTPGAALGAKVNTATFTSTVSGDTGAAAVPQRTATKSVTVVAPAPTLVKTANPATNVGAGQDVVFTLHPGNAAGSPTGHDTQLVDCLPAGLTFTAYGTLPPGVTSITPTAGTGTTQTATSQGCPTGTTLTGFSIGDLPAGASPALTITATVDPNAAGKQSYTNTANVVTSTLADGGISTANESVVGALATATISVTAPTIVKSVSAPTVAAGDSLVYGLTATVPANVNLYNVALTDRLPAGLTVTGTPTCMVDGSPVTCVALTPATAGGRTTVGWSFGTVAAAPGGHTLAVSFTAKLSTTVGIARGTQVTNGSTLTWNATDKGDPTSVTSPSDQNATSATVTSTVTTPAVTIVKGVSTGTPQPGDTFTYTVTATNDNTANTSGAFDTVVTDQVPDGVVVDTASLASNATISGAGANGGGTITWSAVTIAKGASKTYTYRATLTGSANLHTAGLTNTATVQSYRSVEGAGVAYGPSQPATAVVTPAFPRVTAAKQAVGGALAYVDQPFAWGVTLTNGGAPAATVSATDVLPANWTYVAGSARYSTNGAALAAVPDPAVTVSGAVQTLVWSDLGPLAANAFGTLRYQATPGAGATTDPGVDTPQVNRVTPAATDRTGASGNADGSYGGPAATASTTIASADLAIAKAPDEALIAGSTVSGWSITVTNRGPDTAVGPFTVTDTPATLPAGVTITGATGSGWSCGTPASDGSFTCSRTASSDILASGRSFPAISVSVAVASDAAVESLANTATVRGATFDPDPSNDSATSTVTTAQRADLAIAKSAGAVHAGRTVTWQLAVRNLGPSTSRADIVVKDTVPAGVTGVTATGGSDWTCDVAAGVVTCTLPSDLAANTPATPITLTGTLASSFTGTLSNTATVSGTTTDPNPGNDTATASAATATDTTLRVVKTLASPDIVPGSTATFTVSVTNTGDADARNVSISDPLPNGLTYLSSSSSVGTWTCSETSSPPSTVGCDLAGTLSAADGGSTATVSITARVPADLTGTVTNTATGSADNAPSTTGSWTNGSTPTTNLELTKTHPSGAIRAGESVSYTLVATNAGPSVAANGARVVDTLPVGLTFASATGTGWTCSDAGQVVTCDTAATAGVDVEFAPITVTATTDASLDPQTVTNTATATPPAGSIGTPGTASDPTVITSSATLHLVKTVTSGATVVAGQDATYALAVTNDGPSAARSVLLTDLVPAGMTIVSVTGAGWTCDDATGTCSRAVLPPGTSTLTLTARVASSVPQGTDAEPEVLTNSARVAWTDTQGSYTDTSTADVTVRANASLALTKTAVDANGDPVTTADAGTDQRYAIAVTNDGPSDAIGPLRVVDTLPAGLSFVASNADWTCVVDALDAQTVTCETADGSGLAAGATAPRLLLTAHIDPGLTNSSETNTAAVSSRTTDIGTNGTGTSTIVIGAVADLSITKTHSGPTTIGTTVPFRLGVANGGPSDAEGVKVVDVLPTGLTWVDAAGSDPAWDCTAGAAGSTGTPVTCVLGRTLPANAVAPTLVVNATVTAGAYPAVVNTADVSSTTADSDPANNAASDRVSVPALSQLVLRKTHVGDAVRGKTLDYLLAVTNRGPTPDPGVVTVVDRLPRGLSYVSSSGAGVRCAVSGATVSCSFDGAIAVGQTRTIRLTTLVAGDAPDSIVNTATVSSATAQVPPGPGTPTTGTDPNLVSSNTAPVAPAPVPAPGLAFTGANGVWTGLGAALLAMMAGLLLVLRRRRVRVRA